MEEMRTKLTHLYILSGCSAGKLDKSEGIRFPDGRIIQSIGDDTEGYKCLGVLEADDIMHDEVKI